MQFQIKNIHIFLAIVILIIAFGIGIGIHWLSIGNDKLSLYEYIIPPFVVLFLLCIMYMIDSVLNRRNMLKNPVFLQDVSLLDIELDNQSRIVVHQLEQMDFSKIGLVGNPSSGIGQTVLCVYVDKQGFTQAQIASNSSAMRFISIFQDGFCKITTPEYKLEKLKDGEANHIREAYVTHQRTVDAIGMAHGDLQLLDSTQTYLNWEREFGYQQNLDDYRKKAWGCGGLALVLAGILFMLVAFIVKEFVELPEFWIRSLPTVLFIIGIPVFIMLRRIGFITQSSTVNNSSSDILKRDAR